MSNSFVKDKKKKLMSPPKKPWKNLVSTFQSKLNHLRKSSRSLITDAISSRQHHHHHHHQTINNHHHHHHYYYHPQPSDDNQKQLEAEKNLFIDDKACVKPSSEDANSLSMKKEVVPQTITRNTTDRGKHIRIITPESEFDDDENEMERRSGAIAAADCGDSDYFTLSNLQLLDVDARAEEFINQRKEVWRLEKQKSEEEYWKMLARGA